RHYHQLGALHVSALPARLHREQRAHAAPLVLELVRDDTLQARHEGQRSATGPQETVEVHPEDQVRILRRPEVDSRVVEHAVQRVEAGAPAERAYRDLVAELGQALGQPRDAHERATPLQWVEGSRGEDADPQRLPPLEPGRPLLEEGPRALLVVLAVE